MQALHHFAETYLIPVQLVLALFGMGATLNVRDFLLVLRHPKGLALGLALQLVLVPALATAWITLTGMGSGWAVGLLLVAAVPGGATSNIFTHLGRGSVPLSIAVTTATTIACLFTVPLLLRVLASQHLPDDFAFPALRIVRDITLFLLVPLIVGMVAFRYRPARARRLSVWAIRGSVTLIGCVAVTALGSGRIDVVAYGWVPPLAIVGFGLVLAVVTPHVSRIAGFFDDDTVALSIEVVVRNIGISLLLIHFFFPGDDRQGHVLYTSLFYSGISGLLMLPTMLRHRFGRSPVLLRKARPRPPQV